MKSATKFMLASLLIAFITTTLFGLYSLDHYHDNEVKNESVKLEACLRTFWQLLNNKGNVFRIVNGKLMAGTYTVNGNFELPDKVQEIFGCVATVFMGDERVSTNVQTVQGARALGTKLTGPAYEAIFVNDQPYRGSADILGVPYLTAYDPIRDNQGRTIGVLFVGVKESDFLARMHGMKRQMTVTLLTLLGALTFLMVLLGKAMRRVEINNENQIQFQRTLINTIPSPIYYKDSSCRYLGCNKAFEEYTGFSQEELIGKTQHELWTKELADVYRERDLAIFSNPGMQSYETSVRHADGLQRDVIFNKATFEDKNGTPAGLVGVILDITEYKRAENEKAQLESQLTYARLMKTIMIRLGHDLKTPLTPIFILLPLLRKQLTDPEQIKHLDTCMKSAVSIKNLADKTSTLARLSAHPDTHQKRAVSLSALVDGTISDLTDALIQNRQVCRNIVEPSLEVHGMAEQLRELLNNLISNSIFYSKEPGTITISAEQRDGDVLVSVQDQGCGIEVSHLEHVFEEFYKADESRHDLETSGLGLSICKRIVQNHAGRIWAESPGTDGGTTIRFTLAASSPRDSLAGNGEQL